MNQSISHLLAPKGVDHASVLAFFGEQDTSVALHLKQNFLAWVEEKRAAGAPIDDEMVERVTHDLEVHGRLTPETLIGAPHAIYKSLDHTEAQHFGR